MSHYFPAAKPSQPSTRLGRPKGSRNKAGESIRWGLVEAYRQLGGVEGLVKWGSKPSNRGEFYKLLVKVIPAEMAEAGLGQDNRIQVVILPAEGKAAATQALEISAQSSAGTEDAETVRGGTGRGVFRQGDGLEREPEA